MWVTVSIHLPYTYKYNGVAFKLLKTGQDFLPMVSNQSKSTIEGRQMKCVADDNKPTRNARGIELSTSDVIGKSLGWLKPMDRRSSAEASTRK